MISWHYKWDEMSNGGFSLWGKVFESYGANLATLNDAPTSANLKNASVYIIVDPDTEKETEKPNFVKADAYYSDHRLRQKRRRSRAFEQRFRQRGV